MTLFRPLDSEKDREAAHRIWHEVGWLEKDQDKIQDTFLEGSAAWVAELNDQAEGLVTITPAEMRYLSDDLSMAAVTGVTTSRIARRQGIAGRLTAHALAHAASQGFVLAGLGMFEQGFYNQLGFGNGGYENTIHFDPADLIVSQKPRIPVRLTREDFQQVHANRLRRKKSHGACTLLPPAVTSADMQWTTNGFGLGYRDHPEGEISHHFWANAKDVEHGPYAVWWLSYQNDDQLMELLALIKNLGDQVNLVRLNEPPGLQMQDLIRFPLKTRRVRRKSAFEGGVRTVSYWQMRMLDLSACLKKTHLFTGQTLQFNLQLSDPIAEFLPKQGIWRGLTGQYRIVVGADSSARMGFDPALPTLTASVNAFTRLWLGVLPASGLRLVEDLDGPSDLLQALDLAFCLPQPHPDWEF